MNEQTGRPVPHALVEVDGVERAAVLTGPEGTFVFDKLTDGPLMISARKPGFFAPGDSAQQFPRTSIEVGPQMGKVVLKLVPECVISGQVTDHSGEPLEGAVIEALGVMFINGRRELMPVRDNVRTDEDGNFHMAGLKAGRYYVAVKAGATARRILGSQSKAGTEAYPAVVYFPSAGDLASATPIDLVAGQRAQAQFSLKLGPAFKLAGAIAGVSAFKQVSPLVIVDQLERPLFSSNRLDNQSGAFEFPAIPAGTYTLRVHAVDADNRQSWLKETVNLDRDLTNLNLSLQAALTVPVIVRAEFARPHTMSWQHITSDGIESLRRVLPSVYLASVDSPRLQMNAEPGGQGDSPPLIVKGVMPGRYHVQVIAMVGYVYSVRSGGVDLQREELIVPAGGNPSPIEVVLRDDGGALKVRVQSDTAGKHARILLVPEFAPNQPPINLDIEGNVERQYVNLAPGDYKVLAFDSLDGVEYSSPEFLGKYTSKAARVTLSAHATAAITVELIHTGE